MSEALQFSLTRAPLTDPRTGILTRTGVLFLQALWRRAGAETGPSTTDLERALQQAAEELGLRIVALADAEQQRPAAAPPLLPDDQSPAAAPALPPDDQFPVAAPPPPPDDVAPAPAALPLPSDVSPSQTPPLPDPLPDPLATLREELQALRLRVHALEQQP